MKASRHTRHIAVAMSLAGAIALSSIAYAENQIEATAATTDATPSPAPAPVEVPAAAPRYKTLSSVQETFDDGRVGVLEFFSYGCTHCANFQPALEKWTPFMTDLVVFAPVPVAWNASMKDLQRLYFVLQVLNRMDLHTKVFTAVHHEGVNMSDMESMTAWIEEQGIEAEFFKHAFNSDLVTSKVDAANELKDAYEIRSTPSLAVGGKYVITPALAGSPVGAIIEAQHLVETLLDEHASSAPEAEPSADIGAVEAVGASSLAPEASAGAVDGAQLDIEDANL